MSRRSEIYETFFALAKNASTIPVHGVSSALMSTKEEEQILITCLEDNSIEVSNQRPHRELIILVEVVTRFLNSDSIRNTDAPLEAIHSEISARSLGLSGVVVRRGKTDWAFSINDRGYMRATSYYIVKYKLDKDSI